ncbi:hypothetical protein C8F01DRAFT_1312469 [Mycena amicta]|nr:hypothetical protein C8F01DRAFT_1312469 [Mycena amicta]
MPRNSSLYDISAARPSPHTSPLALLQRSRPKLPNDASPELTAFTEAPCEIHSDDIALPIAMASTEGVVAVISVGGGLDRDPTMFIQRLSPIPDAKYNVFGTAWPSVGLANVATELRVDRLRKLAWTADSKRIKSYRWFQTTKRAGWRHTLRSAGFEHAMLLRGTGEAARVLRSGRRGMAIWDVETLSTHGERGQDIVGKESLSETLDSYRDIEDSVKLSKGSPPTLTLDQESVTKITVAQNHPGGGSQILASNSACPSFLGHKKTVKHIATTAGAQEGNGDPNGFVTTSADGLVRLYDVRQPTPRATIHETKDDLLSVLYEYIAGQPFIIYGTMNSQQIQVWDVRNRAPLYELFHRKQLLTQCDNMDRNGNVRNYRWAKIGRHGQEWLGSDAIPAEQEHDEDSEEDDDDDDDDGFDDYRPGWPNDAWHSETTFGVAFDAGEYRIFRYQFKTNADPKILPKYGQGRPRGGNYRL